MRAWVAYLMKRFAMSERKACQAVALPRQSYRYQGQVNTDDDIKQALRQLARDHPRWGFKKMNAVLRKQGNDWNHKRIYRIYCEMKLNLRVKPKKRLPNREKVNLTQPQRPNESWSIDFMSDSLMNGKAIRTMNILDDYNREVLWIEVRHSFPAEQVTRILERVAQWRGYPKQIRSDNGPEFIARHTAQWAQAHGIDWKFIQPGKPNQNGYVERMNRTYREDVLDAYLLQNLEEAQELTEEWMMMYNGQRPHEALGNLTPYEYALAAGN
jgi:putative transposase